MSNQKKHSNVTPYSDGSSKKEQVGRMFDRIAGRYDLLNRVLSLGIDQWWRAKLISHLHPYQPERLLDVATGTGDVAIAAARKLKPKEILAVDIAPKMLEVGRAKIAKAQLTDTITFAESDAENLISSDNSFDALTVAFGVRNFQDTVAGLKECHRVLKPGGRIAILEFSQPTIFPFKQIYHFYFSKILPLIGRITSQDSKAYTYLFESVQTFAQGEDFLELLRKVGFADCQHKKLTLGICALYTAGK